jgi:hypothetical protein
MDEYLMDVQSNDERTTIKTFARTVEQAIDNMVKLPSVEKLFNIGNVDTQELWEFEEDITELRNLRNKLPENIEMFFKVGEN